MKGDRKRKRTGFKKGHAPHYVRPKMAEEDKEPPLKRKYIRVNDAHDRLIPEDKRDCIDVRLLDTDGELYQLKTLREKRTPRITEQPEPVGKVRARYIPRKKKKKEVDDSTGDSLLEEKSLEKSTEDSVTAVKSGKRTPSKLVQQTKLMWESLVKT